MLVVEDILSRNMESAPAQEARIQARPGPSHVRGPSGTHPLGLAKGPRDGLVYAPAGGPDEPRPLLLWLHGAGGHARDGWNLLGTTAEAHGIVLLAPDSRAATWDVIMRGYGPDVSFIDRALAQTFERYAVDPSRLGISGFSDGASYALSLGLTNGRLFSHILAFSPGYVAPKGQPDSPRIYISHGTEDPVLPIQPCSRRLSAALKLAGYDVRFHEFKGGHAVPDDIRREAVDWFLQPKPR